MTLTQLSECSYGKASVRLVKVERHGPRPEMKDLTVAIQAFGAFAAAYSDGDNRLILPTDTMKNTVYVLAREARLKPIRNLTPQWQLVQAPRYKDLTEILQGLLDQGYGLAEIAGNHEILITVIAPDAAKLDIKDTTELFALELDARPGFRRAGLKVRIDRLVDINRDLKAKGVSIEHFYDY